MMGIHGQSPLCQVCDETFIKLCESYMKVKFYQKENKSHSHHPQIHFSQACPHEFLKHTIQTHTHTHKLIPLYFDLLPHRLTFPHSTHTNTHHNKPHTHTSSPLLSTNTLPSPHSHTHTLISLIKPHTHHSHSHSLCSILLSSLFPPSVPWCQGEVLRPLLVIHHCIQIHQMWVIPCGPWLPTHIHNFKHTVWDKEVLSLPCTGSVFDIIDMETLILMVEVDDKEDRVEATLVLST